MKTVHLDYMHYQQIAVVTLDRPAVRHAFNTAMAEQLVTILTQLKNEPVRVVILTSSTQDAFCSGADLKERQGMTDEEWKEQHLLFEQMFQALADLPCPTIAAVTGYALAGGFELALNADLIIAGDNVKIGLTEVTRGIMPGGGGAWLLPKRIGQHIAREWLYTGRIIEAPEAHQVGLFNRLVPTEEVMSVAIQLAETIAANAPLGVRGVKKVSAAYTLPVEEAFQLEIDTYNTVITSEDRLEGIRAFNEKRKPIFEGK